MKLFAAHQHRRGQGVRLAALALLAVASTLPSVYGQTIQPQSSQNSALRPAPVAAGEAAPYAGVPPELRPRSKDVVETSQSAPARQLDEHSVHMHVIEPGESLWSISRLYGVKLTTLMETNQVSRGKILRPGQQLVVTNQAGLTHQVRARETLAGICRDYGVPVSEVLRYNAVPDPQRMAAGTVLFVPGARARRSSSFFAWPVRGRLSSTFGTRRHPMGGGTRFHNGIDIAAPVGREIVAAQDGRVVLAGRNGALGLCVILQHGDGYKTVYGHASRLLVKVGQEVRQGETIALVGHTGQATGSHLHFEIHRNGRPLDPLVVLPRSSR